MSGETFTGDTFSIVKLPRDNGHVLHVERHGTPGGIPTVILHGGPGGGLARGALASFDPARHDIILFDQRGCGQSVPLASLEANTTADLIGDIEAIRAHFGFEAWMVAGGSWGSCLALVYAQAHPERVLALRVHGIFLAGDEDVQWWFQGVRAVFPDHWEVFAGHVDEAERGDLAEAYYRRTTSPDPKTAEEAAWHLRNFSARTQTFEPDEAHIANLLSGPEKYLPVARLFTAYCRARGFLEPGQILRNIDRIRAIPAEIIQGRYDMVTPVQSAWALHKAWPEAGFTLVTLSNHTTSPALLQALTEATTRLASRISETAA